MAESSGRRADVPGPDPAGGRRRHALPDSYPDERTDLAPTSPPSAATRARSRWSWSDPDAEMPQAPAPAEAPDEDDPPDDDMSETGSTSSVRPYFYTRGRTRSAVELEIETLVSVVPGVAPPVGPERVAFELCRETRSVAEVAALAGMPLGVARVLIGDLAGAGAVVVHPAVSAASSEGPALALMQRVLTGLRKL